MAYDLTPRVGDSAHRLLFKIAAATSDVDDPPNPDAPENQLLRRIAAATAAGAGAGGAAWGDITGTLSAQTDLQTALDARLLLSGGTMTGDLTVKAAGLLIPGAVSGVATIQAPPVAGTPTITLPSVTATLATLGANGFTGAQIISVAGANSTSPLHLTGALNVAGTGTTTFPHIFHQPTGATAATTWSNGANAGTVFGANEATGFVGNFFDGKIAGVTTCKIAAVTGAMSVYTYNALNWAVYDSVGGTLRSYENSGTWYGIVGFATIAGNCALQDAYSGLRLRNSYWIGWSADTTYYGTNDLILGRKAAAALQLGADAAGVTNQMLTAASRITSDGVGANLTIAGGNGRGGAGGSLIFSTYSTEGAATIGTLTTRLTLDTTGLLTFADAVDMAFNTTTGTKIGTAADQKLSFWGATPIAQPTTSISGAFFEANSSGLVDDSATWDGYSVGRLVVALRSLGILA